MKGYVKSYNKLSYIVKLILAIIPITGWINSVLYRIAKGNIIVGVIAIFIPIFYILDLITVIFTGKPQILA